MGERGQYRSIAITLLDGKDYRALPSTQRHCFLVLKMNLGYSGIDVKYREELASRLGSQTGYTSGAALDALDGLESSGWVRHEENVFWVLGQLEHDPHLQPGDGKHRKGLLRHLAGLPHLPIVAEFIAAHPRWCLPDEMRLMGLGWALDGPYKGLVSAAQRMGPRNEGTGVNPPKQGPTKGLGSKEKEEEKEKEKELEAEADSGTLVVLAAALSSFPKLYTEIEDADNAMLASLMAKFRAITAGAMVKLVGEIAGALDGIHGPRRTWPELRTNIGDYLLNPAEAANMARLRGYLYRDPTTKTNGAAKPTTGQRAFVAADQAMRNL